MTSDLTTFALRVLQKVSLLEKLPAAEGRRIIDSCILFHGDLPRAHRAPELSRVPATSGPQRGPLPLNYVCTRGFDRPQPVSQIREDVLYSADGFGWHRGQLEERLSVRVVRSPGRVLRRPRRSAARRFEQATLIQSESPNTYGDWVSEQIRCIAVARGVAEPPLLLPGFLGARTYVRHELDRLGIAYVTLDGPAFVERATVLRKPTPLTYWRSEEVAAYRRLFGLSPSEPRPGSILYLSRAGVRSEQALAARDYRSGVIAEAVRALGGSVVETASMSLEDFAPLAVEAETVVADHGAAMFNMMQWRPRHLVEIVADTWWSPCFVSLGLACGVESHVILRAEEGTDDALRARMEETVAALGAS